MLALIVVCLYISFVSLVTLASAILLINLYAHYREWVDLVVGIVLIFVSILLFVGVYYLSGGSG